MKLTAPAGDYLLAITIMNAMAFAFMFIITVDWVSYLGMAFVAVVFVGGLIAGMIDDSPQR